MVNKLKAAALAGLSLLVVQPAAAATLVDTGQPTQQFGGTTVAQYQWLAGEFTLSSAATITQVQGWLGTGAPSVGVRAAIYSDGGDAPGTKLFSADFTAISSGGSWQGADGLAWALGAGDYWISFETDSSDPSAYMPLGAPGLLNRYAFTSNQGTSWMQNGFSGNGVRIFGNAGAVPEPAAWGLMILGFAAIGAVARRRTNTVATFA